MMKMLMHGMIIMLIDGDNWLICVNGFERHWPAGCSQGLIALIVLVISHPGCIIMIVAMYIYMMVLLLNMMIMMILHVMNLMVLL